MAGGKHQDKPATETMTSERTLSSRNGCKGTSYVGSGIIGSLAERQTQRDKDLAALERMKALERERLAQSKHIQLCPRSRAHLYMTPGSDYGTRLIQQTQAKQ